MSLIINIENIPEQGIKLEENFDRGWLTNIPEYTYVNDLAYVKDRIRLSGSLTKEGNNLHLRGKVKLIIHTICSRCGDELDYEINSQFELVLMPGSERISEMEKELSSEDLEHIYYQGEELDLAPYFQEQIALEVPIQFLCYENCKGLCPGCGANLNYQTCDCSKKSEDPRLKVLKKLKIEK